MSSQKDTPLDSLFCLSASTRSGATVSDRERLALPSKLMLPFLKGTFHEDSLSQGFLYLSTCHRVEVYGYAYDPHQLSDAWCDATEVKDKKILRSLRGPAALEHFVRVAAGLESTIVGENQIMAQVRQSLREGRESEILSSSLSHILQKALRVARDIRYESRIGEGRENLSSLAILSLHEFFESLTDKNVLVVGAGTMSLLAIEKLRQLKVSNITWVNRSQEKVESHPYARFSRVANYSDLGKLVAESDVTILATRAQEPILSKTTEGLISQKNSSKSDSKKNPRLRVVLDLGLPRNADSSLQELGFYLRNVDDFSGILNNQDALQKERIEYAEKVLRRQIDHVQRDLDLSLIGPLKNEFLQKWKWLAESLSVENLDNKNKDPHTYLRPTTIGLENSTQIGYNQQRLWAKLGHVLMTKANELGPLEGGQFLRHLCESFDAVEGLTGLDSNLSNTVENRLNKKVLSLFKTNS